MKQLPFFVFFCLLAGVFLSSCSDTKTYAESLKEEENLISDYLKRNNIEVRSTFPADSSTWRQNEYTLTKSGLYYRSSYKGDVSAQVETGNTVIPRYYQYTLNVVPDTISRWSTLDVTNPDSFTLGNTSESCTAFHEAASYMKYWESEADIIVPSKIGFNQYMLTVTPMRYHLKIRWKI